MQFKRTLKIAAKCALSNDSMGCIIYIPVLLDFQLCTKILPVNAILIAYLYALVVT